MIINVIGMGHVGLPTAILLAHYGNRVIGTDNNDELIKSLVSKTKIIDDEFLRQYYFSSVGSSLFFNNVPVTAEIHIIAVPTPFNKETKKVDLNYIYNVIDQLILLNQKEFLIVVESTISPGTINHLKLKYNQVNKKISFAHSPERVMPGNTYYELINNNRTIGADNIETFNVIKNLYKEFVKGEITHTDILSAELSKVIENTFRDVNIAFANEIAIICNKLKLDASKIIEVANLHPRVNILSPGPGVGGHCIPVDPWFLVGDFPENTQLIRAAREVNDKMPEYIKLRILSISDYYNLSLNDIGLYGLTYKENVKDFRESPSFRILESFKSTHGINLKSFDPFNHEPEALDSNFLMFLKGIKLIVILVHHDHLRLNIEFIKEKMIFDTKNKIHYSHVIKL
jgi:UDP-N-acetyl-D-mannosaminuronic acid dehydrogenase